MTKGGGGAGGSGSLMDGTSQLEIQQLTNSIKHDLGRLNGQVADLQRSMSVAHNHGGSRGASEEHNSQVVMSLQHRLATASASFTTTLEEHSQSIRHQKERREQFSATAATTLLPPSQSVNRRSTRSPGPGMDGGVSIEIPGSGPSDSLQQLTLQSNNKSDLAYMESRNVALQGIESTINELGAIYQRLATMISEQGETVQRIDFNIEEMQLNIERGQGELMKYLRSVSSNRWLMIKIFAVLIVFIIFFSIFLI